ncbi:MAG: membrane protein insertase YidC [Lachnospiraceae bacterium]|nr:membrane protein insertase YidC [Lachnospiraceae bacterium]
MLSTLYNLIVQPLVLTIEVIFVLLHRVLKNPGLSIVGVSLVVNFLILPLYRRADVMQEAERNKQESMKHWVDHIKKTFKGDEQYMMLQTYYRQQDYHPLHALKSSISLLLQIPFFIAAYRFLSDLALLEGASFLFIRDLSQPDALFTIGGFTVNILPILMTVINLISGAIYSRGFPLSSKIQQYVLTILFLVLLYDRPAGLVMYWTLNNVFSLVKNIFYKVLKHPKEIFAVLAAAFGICVYGYLALTGKLWSRKRILFLGAIVLVTLLPLINLILEKTGWSEKLRRKEAPEPIPAHYFLLGGIFLTLLIGFVIPEAIIADSPLEFVEKMAYRNPIRYSLGTMALTAGFFLVWGNVFYYLADTRFKRVFTGLYWVASIGCVLTYMFFGRNLGDISTDLVFDNSPSYSGQERMLNTLLLLVVLAVCWAIWKYRKKLIPTVYIIGTLGLAGLSASSIMNMQKGIAEADYLFPAGEVEETEIEPIFRLSKTGKNVIVLMMDRAIGSYFPYIMKQRPELVEQFKGFTWYPNSISLGGKTNYGSPEVFGGYEYTPVEINRRTDDLLVDKQNEALKMMPVMFLNEGYEVTVCDPPYAGYEWIPDLSIFDEYPDIKTYNTMGSYTAEFKAFRAEYEKLQMRNFFFYSIFKASPVVLQKAVYDKGKYYASSDNTRVEQKFLESYSVMIHLNDLTEITDDDTNTLLCMTNKMTHEDTLLQMPDFEMSLHVDNDDYYDYDFYNIDGKVCKMGGNGKNAPTGAKFRHFCVNVRSYMELGKWFDYMRENGVYDNTRIILVSDHGRKLEQFDDLNHEGKLDVEQFDCLLAVKDFGSTELTTNYDFMTACDTPTLATEGLIEDPVNPFTGVAINSDDKTAHPLLATTSKNWRTDNRTDATQLLSKKETWFSIHDNIFDPDCWTEIGSWDDVVAMLKSKDEWPE